MGKALLKDPPEWLRPWLRPGAGIDAPDERLQRVLAAWPTLPEHVRLAVMALIQTAG